MPTALPPNRRDFLRGVGAAAGALPLLGATSRATAAGIFPRRFIFVFSANGTIYENWLPTGSETSFTLGRILEPLKAHQKDLVILDNVRNQAAHNGPGDGHMKGMGCLLTATELLPGTQFRCGGTTPCSGWGGGISVDQFIANKLNPPTRFKTLELAVQAGGASVWSRMCYAGPDRPIAPMEDPTAVFKRVFGELAGGREELERLRAQRRSVLDYVSGRLRTLERRLDGEDRSKLQAHLEGIRDIEKQLSAAQTTADAPCARPEIPAGLTARSDYRAVLKAQTDLLVRSLACDMTRVATLQWSRSVSGVRLSWLGIDRNHHDLSHDGDSNLTTREQLTKINVWYAEQFAYLLDGLKSVREGNGTMLDNTVVLWGNELGKGNSHTRTKIPFVMAGSAGGYFRTGRFLRYNNDSHSNLLVSICQAMGVETNTFGNPAYCTGPLRMLR